MPSKQTNPRRRFGARFRRAYSNWFGSRGIQARGIRKGRQLDRNAYAGKNPMYVVSQGVTEYSNLFNTNFYVETQRFIDRKGRASVLDIGAGEGRFLQQLKKKFGLKVKTVATGFTRPPNLNGIDAYHVVQISKESSAQKLREKHGPFDIIVSVSGEPQIMHPEKIASRIKTLMSPKGVAFIDLGQLQPGHEITELEEEAIEILKKEGFEVTVFKSPQMITSLQIQQALTLVRLRFKKSA